MALFTESDLRARADRGTPLQKSASNVLSEKVLRSAGVKEFDIFLSHSFSDQKLILGIWLSLEDMGYKVYVDWIHDRQLSRENVNKETASVLRQRMLNCKSLFFATTANSSSSKWMPWELGFKDGHNRRAAILPVVQYASSTFTGQEYLAIYPYVVKDQAANVPGDKLWIHTSPTCYVIFDSWLKGSDPIQR
jgi:hypothetical protein